MLIFLLIGQVQSLNQYCSGTTCSSCSTGYLYQLKSCLSICPTTFDTQAQSCQSLGTNEVFALDLFKYQDYSTSTVGDFVSNNNEKFNNVDQLTGTPTKDRGFYFTDTSIGLKHTSNKVPAPDLTLKFLIKFLVAGVIFSVNEGIDQSILLTMYFSGAEFGISLTVKYLNPSFVSTKKEVKAAFSTKDWHKCSVTLKQNIENFALSVCGNEEIISGEFKGASSTVCIGSCLALSSFKGFLYYFYMINSYDTNHYESYSPADCPITHFYDYINSRCVTCGGSSWPPCSYASGNACYSPSCKKCTSYSYSGCTECVSGTAPECKCGKNCGTCTSTFQCTTCTLGTLIDGLCLFPSSTESSGVFQKINLVFNYFSGRFGPFLSGSDSSTFYPSDNPSADDPVPAKNRGLYFNGQAFLVSSSAFSLNYEFSLVYWIRGSSGTGVWSSPYFACYFDTHCKISLSSTDETRTFITGRRFNYNTWNFYSYTLQFINSISTFTTKINDAYIEDFSASGYVFYDEGGQVYVGKDSSGYFVGFIYLIQLQDYSSTTSIFADAACGSSKYGSCLWGCDIDKFVSSNIASSCAASCLSGCVRPNSCNLCSNLKCQKCSSFDGGCLSCISGTVKNGDSCECPASTYFDESSLTCKDCIFECPTCRSAVICESCISELKLVSGKCLCKDSKQYWDGSKCLQCRDGCVTCTIDTCEKCPDGTYFDSSSWTCKSCVKPCLTCKSSSQCITCIENSERVNSECICIKDYGFNGKTCEKCKNYSSDGVCQDCPVLCSKCESSTKCSSCESRSILRDNLCECIEGDTLINSHCAKCESFIENKVCQSCPLLCLSCVARDQCLSCTEDSELKNGLCQCKEGFVETNQTCQPCPSSTYYSKGRCINCPSFCQECLSRNFCTVCIENAVIVDSKCQCESGYSGDQCTRSYFSFSFEVFRNNSFVLAFSEDLLRTLSRSDVQIEFDEQSFQDFYIEKKTLTEYLVVVEFQDDVKEGNVLSVTLDQSLLSYTNSLLNFTSFEFKVYEFLTQETQRFRESQNIGTITGQVFISIAAFSAVFNNQNPSVVWGFISVIQASCYLRLLAFKLPLRFDGLLKGLTSYNIIPNLFSNVDESEKISVKNEKIRKYGFITSNILENTGKIILIFIAISVFLVHLSLGIHIVAVIIVFARDVSSKIIQKINTKKVSPNQVTTEINMTTDKNEMSFSNIGKTIIKEEKAATKEPTSCTDSIPVRFDRT